MDNALTLRKKKKELYLGLLEKGPQNLTATEKQILTLLSTDEDILWLLRHDYIFEVSTKGK